MKSRIHFIVINRKSIILALIGVAISIAAIIFVVGILSGNRGKPGKTDNGYVILAMNDLGMHCYQSDYSGFLILPPGNTLKVQVFKKGTSSAELINSGIEVSYEIIDNTSSANKINFWVYAKDYGYDVPPDVGITGNGLKGVLKLSPDGKYYEVTSIPVTPFNDGSTVLNPLQLARIQVSEIKTGKILASTGNIVVPVSNEMDCSICHGADQTDLNILKAHDELSKTTLANDLLNGKRYKCSDCHKDNILGQSGNPDVLPLSQAMHGFHADKMVESNVTPTCYSCHPGPVTRCNRGAMYLAGIDCDNPQCHGNMANVASTQAEGRQAWLQEPDCGDCHDSAYDVNPDTLYRNSYLLNSPSTEMNDLILCESCHNGTHAEWASSQPKDNLLPISLLGYASYINKCTVCHEGEGKIHRSTE